MTGNGKYCLVLVFEAKALELSDFEKRQVGELILIFSDFFFLQLRIHRIENLIETKIMNL